MDAAYITEDSIEYLKESKDGLIRHGPEVIEALKKECNIENRRDLENALVAIENWIKQQEHFVKKDFSRQYLIRCIGTSKGSIERAKKQIDRLCTFRTLMPKYFQFVDLKDSHVMAGFEIAQFTVLPQLTEEYYRVIILKLKPNITLKTSDFDILHKILIIVAEYCKAYDCCRGYLFISDIFDANTADLISKIDLLELQQFLPILTEGYGTKIKGMYIVTASKLIEGFLKMFKQLFSAKIASRMHAVTSRSAIKDLINGDVLPKDYGGPEKPVEQLHDDMVECLSSEPVKKLLAEMNQAVTDESKRQIHKFNDEFMGMPGTFRNISLD